LIWSACMEVSFELLASGFLLKVFGSLMVIALFPL
jgi:hypothetical protein